MPVYSHAHLHWNWLFQVVALDNLLFLVMIDNVVNTASEKVTGNSARHVSNCKSKHNIGPMAQ